MEQIFADITVCIKESSVVAQGMETFIKRYKDMSSRGKFANAALASSLHRFGWVFGGTTKGGISSSWSSNSSKHLEDDVAPSPEVKRKSHREDLSTHAILELTP